MMTIIAQLRDFSLHLDLKEGDIVYSNSPVGWAAFDYLIPNLALGVTLLFFNGSPEYVGEFTFWDILAENKVSFAFLPSAYVNSFQTDCILPKPDTNLESLKILGLAGSPVRPQDYKFLLNSIKSDLLILSLYGATEVVGAFSGSDLNSPFHALRMPSALVGVVDLHIFDLEKRQVLSVHNYVKSNSILGKGKLVVTEAKPNCLYIFGKTEDNTQLNDRITSVNIKE
ncbi:hypothetical protein CEXT_45271 [Caerostris extrusa]|uniref:AMP-dependent synthetase/ligase domain-containing protein n=1 Tax=Caerostris extrusa TaxID=172846 RepID=A0AAV4PHD1_CAEEX|nr:hypothetical protein CEXT_45271 [Caerostris extrusa]